jgi:hypothetical protein
MARTFRYGEKVPLEEQFKVLDDRVELIRANIKKNEANGFEREFILKMAKKRKASPEEIKMLEDQCVAIDKMIDEDEQAIKDTLAEKGLLTRNREGKRAEKKIAAKPRKAPAKVTKKVVKKATTVRARR